MSIGSGTFQRNEKDSLVEVILIKRREKMLDRIKGLLSITLLVCVVFAILAEAQDNEFPIISYGCPRTDYLGCRLYFYDAKDAGFNTIYDSKHQFSGFELWLKVSSDKGKNGR